MQKIPVSFYVLSDNKAQDFLGFIGQLTQTALNKSTQSLLILIDDEQLLESLDKALWEHDATSFIPHQRLEANATVSTNEALAPVLLAAHLPSEFNGIVINTTARPVNDLMSATSHTKITRILEIIKPDTQSVEEGRLKYKRYQQADYELTHFKV